MTRTATLKSKIEDAKASHSSLLELFWRLKNGDELEVESLVQRIRSGADILDGSLPRRLGHGDVSGQTANVPGRAAHAHALMTERDEETQNCATIRELGQMHDRPNIWTRSTTVPTFPPDPPSANMNAQSEMSPLMVATGFENFPLPPTHHQPNRLLPYTHDKGYQSHLHYSLRSHLTMIRKGFAIKRSCISEIFFCHDDIAFDQLFNILLQPEEFNIPPSVLCEILAVAATSGQYVRDTLSPSLIDYWYSKLCTMHLIIVLERLGSFEYRRSEAFLR